MKPFSRMTHRICLAVLLTFAHFASDLAAATPSRVVVLGDSILWGQGLLEGDKIHSRVANLFEDCLGSRPSEITSLAHSGATIGVGDTNLGTRLDGEIATKFPTVLRQCDD